MKIAVLYIRVSTEEQSKQGISIETQLNTCMDFATKNGYCVKNVYVEEGLSAKNLNRPKAQEMLKYCNISKNNVQAIIVWRLDRLSRFNVDYHGTIRPILINHNIKLLSATEVNLDTIEGEYMRNMMMCNAEYELSLIRFRTKENMKTIAQSGRKPAKAPIGYLNYQEILADKTVKKYIIVDEENAHYVKRAFELYATGMYSFKSLGDTLYLEGFKHPKTGEKYPPRKFEWMLHNIFYIGKFEWGGEIYEGSHTPIISNELFYRVQALFEGIDRAKKHDVKFAYTGLIKCADCGCYLTAEYKKGRNNKGHYIYYHCSNSKGYHKKLKCHREEYFDNTFANVLETIHLTPEHVKRVKLLARDYLQEFSQYEQLTSKDIQTQINILKKRIQSSYIDKLEGRLPACISDEEFNKMHREWQEEKDKLLIKLNECNTSTKFIHKRIDMILKFSENLPELFLKGTPEEKKLIISTMANGLKFDGKNLIIELKETFKALQNVKKSVKFENINDDLINTSNSIISIKNDVLETSFVNGADDGIRTHVYRNHNPRS